MAYTALFSAKFQHDGRVVGKADSKANQVVESLGKPGTGFALSGDLAGANHRPMGSFAKAVKVSAIGLLDE